jgi:hypothetical protein
MAERLRDPQIRQRFSDAQIDLDRVVNEVFAMPPRSYTPEFDRRILVDVNLDLFPQDEFVRPYSAAVVPLGPERR